MTYHPYHIKITITGADDGIDPQLLLNWSAAYPFVEWGILLSPGRIGTPRYPTRAWLERLADLWQKGNRSQNFAAHVCGETSRMFQQGTIARLDLPFSEMFRRVQINGFRPELAGGLRGNMGDSFRYILPFRDKMAMDSTLEYIAERNRKSRKDGILAQLLFDPSGGKGLSGEFSDWPRFHRESCLQVGYAGGIGPDNILSAVSYACKFASGPWNTWLDMESGVRVNNAMSVDKVQEVLFLANRVNEIVSRSMPASFGDEKVGAELMSIAASAIALMESCQCESVRAVNAANLLDSALRGHP